MFKADVLKKCRKSARLSVERLAVEIAINTGYSVTRQAIDNWEKGRNQPSVSALISLAQFFNKPMIFFFDQKQSKAGYVQRRVANA